MSTISPAPWHVVHTGHMKRYDIRDAQDWLVCTVEGWMNGSQGYAAPANARLIAAAPDLLAALEKLEAGIRLWISRGVSPEELAEAQAAIAKAKGDAP